MEEILHLIILNKIDRESNPDIIVRNVKCNITNNLLDQLNLSNNMFIPFDSRQLRNQTLMKESFEYYLFFFNEYIDKSVIQFKYKDEKSLVEYGHYIENYSFLNFWRIN